MKAIAFFTPVIADGVAIFEPTKYYAATEAASQAVAAGLAEFVELEAPENVAAFKRGPHDVIELIVTKAVKFQVPHFDNGEMVYEPGRLYAVTAETARAVAAGNATFVDASAALVPRKTTLGVMELVEPVDEAAALRAQLEQQRADAAAQAAAIAAAEQQLAALEAGG